MLETVLAVLFVTFAFLFLFKLSQLLTGKILVQHAAMRVARARAVGLNDFICLKSARIAVIPVAGACTWPPDKLDVEQELGRIGIYLQARTPPLARGVLDYEGWNYLRVDAGNGTKSEVRLRTGWMDDADSAYFGFDLKGQAGIEQNYPLYMDNAGL